jgi:signal transduction histidine kinase
MPRPRSGFSVIVPRCDKEVALLSKWPIRLKVHIGVGLLLLLLAILAGSGLYTTYAYRQLVKTLSARVIELPVAGQLSRHVGDLRITLSELRGLRAWSYPTAESEQIPLRIRMVRDQFRSGLDQVEQTLDTYRGLLEQKRAEGSQMADNQREWETVHKIESALQKVHEANRDEDWMLDDVKVGLLETELSRLQLLAAELPSHLHHRLAGFAAQVRSRYRTLIIGTWVISVAATLLFGLFLKLFQRWVLRPLEMLIRGSRKVASGMFNYRIHLDTDDEMSELAEAMNNMTSRFLAIRDDLDRQVQERTRQVVRSEQLASVGFLAAGVSHEINNPLASIALCAESLDSRVREILDTGSPDHEVIAHYLQMIQSEAFRCKEITEKLLDFSRMGEVKRQNTELGELVQNVIDMVSHLGKYSGKEIRFESDDAVIAPVNAQEIKQVVLNLLTNALDSVDDDGRVRVDLRQRDGAAELSFVDNGCGMPPEVLQHIFEPFFTRRRSGQGTGLGLSITYRIVSEHGGELEAHSDGSGRGATFRVRLPLTEKQEERENQYQAA